MSWDEAEGLLALVTRSEPMECNFGLLRGANSLYEKGQQSAPRAQEIQLCIFFGRESVGRTNVHGPGV